MAERGLERTPGPVVEWGSQGVSGASSVEGGLAATHPRVLPMLILVDVQQPLRGAFQDWAASRRLDVVRLEAVDDPAALIDAPTLTVIEAEEDAAVGPERMRRLSKITQSAPVVVVARRLAIDTVVSLLRAGVSDVIGLPAAPADVVARAAMHVEAADFGREALDWVGQSRSVRRLRQEIAAVGPMRSTVLVSGETGTGKTLVGRMLHRLSHRGRQPFVHVDCGSLVSDTCNEELFGGDEGGPLGPRTGHIQRADRGTLFLDDVEELPAPAQARLVQVLRERPGQAGGAPVGARIIAASSADLPEAVREGRLRSDLYFRLNVFELKLPPLRERADDIPLLVRHQLEGLSKRLGSDMPKVVGPFYEALATYDWPGNVRELFNLLERLLVRAPGAPLDAASLEGLLPTLGPAPEVPEAECDDEDAEERRRLAEVLVSTGGNVARAARRLDMARSTLRYRIQRLGLGALIPDD